MRVRSGESEGWGMDGKDEDCISVMNMKWLRIRWEMCEYLMLEAAFENN